MKLEAHKLYIEYCILIIPDKSLVKGSLTPSQTRRKGGQAGKPIVRKIILTNQDEYLYYSADWLEKTRGGHQVEKIIWRQGIVGLIGRRISWKNP